MSKLSSVNSFVIEVYMGKNDSLVIDRIDDVNPPVIQIGIGKKRDLPLISGIVQSIIESIDDIRAVVLPENIPSYMIGFLSPLMNIDVNHYYVNGDMTGLDVEAYNVIPGNLPDEINLCHRLDYKKTVPETISSPSLNMNIKFNTIAKPTSDKTYVSTFNRDGFKPLDGEINDVDDGFHPVAEEGSLDDIVDGFHDYPVEKREMWVEDPVRMNRLSYLPIAAVLDEDTFPESLGGGRIR